MRNAVILKVLGTVVVVGAGLWLVGCKSAPELTQDQAQALIQAKYDQSPVGADITVDIVGMRQGLAAKYWSLTKIYPNKFWADYTLTPDGKKAIKLSGGGDVIQWRPETANDSHYSVIVTTVAANPLKARELKDVQDEVLPGVSTAKGVEFTESVNLEGLPAALNDIAHNPGNRLSTKRQADFSLENGAWKLHSIE